MTAVRVVMGVLAFASAGAVLAALYTWWRHARASLTVILLLALALTCRALYGVLDWLFGTVG